MAKSKRSSLLLFVVLALVAVLVAFLYFSPSGTTIEKFQSTPTPNVINGSMVQRNLPIQKVDVDNVGNPVYLAYDNANGSNYLKMVNGTTKEARYTKGYITDYNPASWPSYNLASPGGYVAAYVASPPAPDTPQGSAPKTATVTKSLLVTNGLAMWFDAADTSTITLNGGLVTQWNDKSGNNRNLTNGSATAPLYTTNGYNGGYPALVFNGKNALLSTAPIAPTPVLSANGTDTTIFVVLNRIANAPNSVVFGLGINNNTYVLRDPWASSNNIILDLGPTARLSQGFTTTGNIIYSMGRSGNTLAIYNTGTNIGSATGSGSIPTTSQVFSVGGGVADGTFYNSLISEFIVYNVALSTADRQKIEGYLAYKWGLGLPAGHPYVSTPPPQPPPAVTNVAGVSVSCPPCIPNMEMCARHYMCHAQSGMVPIPQDPPPPAPAPAAPSNESPPIPPAVFTS